MTFTEIRQHYPNEWVLIEFTELDEELGVVEGHVVAHSSGKTDIYQKLPVSNNAGCQEQSKQAVTKRLPFRFGLFDGWCAAADTRKFINQNQQRDVICPRKTKRKVALSLAAKPQGR